MDLLADIAQGVKVWPGRMKRLMMTAACIGCVLTGGARGLTTAGDPDMVATFYTSRSNKLLWYADSSGRILRYNLLGLLSRCGSQGLEPDKYSLNILQAYEQQHDQRTDQAAEADRRYTRAFINYLEDLLHGAYADGISDDALLKKEQSRDQRQILDLLARCTDSAAMNSAVKSLEPGDREYLLLKNALSEALDKGQQDTICLLKTALNHYRRIHHPHYPKCVEINIASGILRYYEHDSLMLSMKVVAGRPSTPTPRFSAYCDEVILYPYWNVPHSIAVNEFLPLCKKLPGVLDFMNMQVLDRKGHIVDRNKINWQLYNRNNFPYRFRQATGCDNALGVIKFNLDSPYGVYLHDTNNKLSFAAKKRYFSHGCIRLEKPMELADQLLGRKLDHEFLETCLKQEQPQTLQLSAPVPVFVVYIRAVADDPGGNVTYYDDVYNLK